MRVLIKGAGDLATGIACRLHRSGFQVAMTEIEQPTTVRRTVAFSTAVWDGEAAVEGITGRLCGTPEEVRAAAERDEIAVLVDPDCRTLSWWKPDVLVDAVIAKVNTGTSITDAPIVIGVGPGFAAGIDCHCVVETKRGHDLGRCISEGSAAPNSGVPGIIGGYGLERLVRAEAAGVFRGTEDIAARVQAGQTVGYVETGREQVPVKAQIDGVLRGILHDGVEVHPGMKAGDVDPRDVEQHCFTVSDKARAIGGGVLEAILAAEKSRKRAVSRGTVHMVLLAAGASSRFGENKLLFPVNQTPMYQLMAGKILEVEKILAEKAPGGGKAEKALGGGKAAGEPRPRPVLGRKILVTGSPQMAGELGEKGFEIVWNGKPEAGIARSVSLAAKALGGTPGAVCYLVCDQPLLRPETAAEFLIAWAESGCGMGSLEFAGRPGSPAVFDERYRGELAELKGDRGGRQVMNRHPEDVFFYEAPDGRELMDVDTQEDKKWLK